MFDQRGAGRSLSDHPFELVGERMTLLEDLLGAASELQRVAFVRHAKPPDGHAFHPLGSGPELVTPCDVVGRARRQHLDVRVPGEMFGDVAGVQLRAAVDRLTVALNDDGDLHWVSSVSGGLAGGGISGSDGCAGAPAKLSRSSLALVSGA